MKPIDAIKMLKERLITIQIHDLNEFTPRAHDVPLGDGIIEFETILEYVKDSGIKPVLFAFEYSNYEETALPEIIKSIDFFNTQIRKSVPIVKK